LRELQGKLEQQQQLENHRELKAELSDHQVVIVLGLTG
jgi:hypothetical protein